jgi:hypothetical protein
MGCFYDMLDKAGLNSCIIYNESMSTKMSRRDFLIALGKELCDVQRKKVEENGITCIQALRNKDRISRKRVHCNVLDCPNKTNNMCVNCHKMYCGQHSDKVTKCHSCINDRA